jgi:hypothetical protein
VTYDGSVGRFTTLLVLLTACGRFGFDGGDDDDVDAQLGNGDGTGADSVTPNVINTGTTSLAASYGGTGSEEGYDVAVSSTGTVAATGTFQGSFMIGATLITSVGGDDVFIATFSSDGTPGWTRTLGGAPGDRGTGIAFDAAGNVYVCGFFQGTANFGGTNKTSAGADDVFVVSYDASGTFRWSATAGGVNNDIAYDLEIDPSGNVLVTGYYNGAVDFGMGPLPVGGAEDIFVAKYNGSSGALMWARGFGGTGAFDTGHGVTVDGSGRVYAVGDLGGAADFGGGAIGAAGGGFILALDPAGTYGWAKPMTNTIPWKVAYDAGTSQLVFAGRASATGTDVGDGPVTATYGGSDDGMVVAFSTAGMMAWHRELGGDLSDIGLGITTDGTGNTYMIGLGGTNLSGAGATTVTGNGMQDIYVVAIDATHTTRWGKMYGGTTQDRGYGVAVAPDGALWITGRYAGTADFGKGPSTAVGGSDLFLTKLY